MSNPIRLGVIGCGKGARMVHLPALSKNRQFAVSAIADIDPERLRTIGDHFDVPNRFQHHRDLLENSQVDAVAILTPTTSHTEIACEVLSADKHLLIDKPLAASAEECRRIIAAAASSSAKVVVGLNFRWHRLVRLARQMIRDGRLGKLRAIRSVYTHWHVGDSVQPWHRERAFGGGVTFNDGVHHFDLWRFLLDGEVVSVQALNRESTEFDDDTSAIIAEMSDNVLASAVLSFSTSPNSELEIFGDRGRLQISCYEFDGLRYFSSQEYPGSVGGRLRRIASTLEALPGALPNLRHGGDFAATHHHLWQHFADCIRLDLEEECTLEDGLKAVAVAEAAQLSAETGTPAQVD